MPLTLVFSGKNPYSGGKNAPLQTAKKFIGFLLLPNGIEATIKKNSIGHSSRNHQYPLQKPWNSTEILREHMYNLNQMLLFLIGYLFACFLFLLNLPPTTDEKGSLKHIGTFPMQKSENRWFILSGQVCEYRNMGQHREYVDILTTYISHNFLCIKHSS